LPSEVTPTTVTCERAEPIERVLNMGWAVYGAPGAQKRHSPVIADGAVGNCI